MKRSKIIYDNKPILALIIFSVFFGIYFIFDIWEKKYKEEKLINHNFTYAVIIETMSSTYKSLPNLNYKYLIDKNPFFVYNEEINNEDFKKIQKGDTILIMYSREDNSVAKIVKCYWNEELRKKFVKSK